MTDRPAGRLDAGPSARWPRGRHLRTGAEGGAAPASAFSQRVIVAAVHGAPRRVRPGAHHTLLRIAERELYRPLWSERILDEAADATLAIHPDLEPDVVAKRFIAMNETFDDARVWGWEVLEAMLAFPDADDRHVRAGRPTPGSDAVPGFLVARCRRWGHV